MISYVLIKQSSCRLKIIGHYDSLVRISRATIAQAAGHFLSFSRLITQNRDKQGWRRRVKRYTQIHHLILPTAALLKDSDFCVFLTWHQ